MNLKQRITLGAIALTAAVPAFADADPFTGVLTTATSSSVLYAGGLVGLAGSTVVIMIAMKYVKKLRGAA